MARGRLREVGPLLMLIVLSGCADAADPATTRRAEPPLLAGMGGIDGFVLDPALAPIPGAQVGLVEAGIVVETGADGSFRFDDVPPGRHQLAAQRLGYTSVVASVDVVEGERATRTLTLEPLPSTAPYFEVLVQRGSFGCGIAYRPQQAGIVGASVCGAITVYAGENQFDRFLLLWELVGPYEGWQGAAYEMEWQTTQALGSGLWVRFETEGCSGNLGSTFTSLRGRSPLRDVQGASMVAERVASNEESDCGSADHCAPSECVFQSRVFPHTEVLGDSYPADVGVTIQQPFTQYFSQFFHGEPSPEYSALADA